MKFDYCYIFTAWVIYNSFIIHKYARNIAEEVANAYSWYKASMQENIIYQYSVIVYL